MFLLIFIFFLFFLCWVFQQFLIRFRLSSLLFPDQPDVVSSMFLYVASRLIFFVFSLFLPFPPSLFVWLCSSWHSFCSPPSVSLHEFISSVSLWWQHAILFLVCVHLGLICSSSSWASSKTVSLLFSVFVAVTLDCNVKLKVVYFLVWLLVSIHLL